MRDGPDGMPGILAEHRRPPSAYLAAHRGRLGLMHGCPEAAAVALDVPDLAIWHLQLAEVSLTGVVP